MGPDLIRRLDATNNTLRKYRGKLFDWKSGVTCAHLLRFHLKKLGHPVLPIPPMRSAIGARRALDQLGCANMGELLAGPLALPAIAPAMMLMGDLVIGESAEGLGGVMICAGPHKVFGWTEEVPRLAVWDADFGQFSQAFRA